MQQTASGLFVEPLDSAARRHAASGLYRDVFGYADSAHAVSPRLLRALLDHGGSALGAYDGDGAMLGFCYGFSAVDGDGVYHYSQAVAVHERARGLGVGRALKLAQAEVARSAGARSMRWAFDPTLTRNTHFNLGVLGAKVTAFHPAYYGEPGSDRAIARWTLDHTSHQVEREAAAAAADRSQRAAD
uniref:GNAT family N-acetyltransferase n=1 Tax=Agromyces humi TaxID=1766800 RepID=UPI00135863CB